MADQVTAERWLPIAGWPYEVSDLGRVRRTVLYRSCNKDGSVKQTQLKHGYMSVKLYRNGRGKTFIVHPLVASAFHGEKPSSRHHAAHFDGDKKNNRANNIRWASPEENSADKVRHGTVSQGESHGRSKLTYSDVTFIRSSDISSREIARSLGVHQSTVVDARNGKTWKHVA